jgi:uncharacterized RDD family membrane protein YckC
MSSTLPSTKQGQRAGLISRGAASAIDVALVGLLATALYLGLAGLIFAVNPRGFQFPRPDFAVSLAVSSVLAVLYLGIGWSASGRTLGDQVAGLRVLEGSGARPSLLVAYLRALLCVIFPAGLLWCAFSRGNLSVQDIILRTVVVYDWSHRIPERAPRG